MANVRIQNVSKEYSPQVRALNNVTLSVEPREMISIVGPSGSGKTTLLRLLAGLELATSGSIFIQECDVTQLPSRARCVSMVFQSSALWPHLSVRQNLRFGPRLRAGLLRPRRWLDRVFFKTNSATQEQSTKEIDASIDQFSEMLGIGHLLDRMPDQLSGGEAQRVAIGRALLRKPSLLLLDEPFAGLDTPLRVELRSQFTTWQAMLGITTLLVTHDQTEALVLGERVAVLDKGNLLQFAEPKELLQNPTSDFVAQFLQERVHGEFRTKSPRNSPIASLQGAKP